MADRHSKILDAPGPIFFIFMQFSLKFGQTIASSAEKVQNRIFTRLLN